MTKIGPFDILNSIPYKDKEFTEDEVNSNLPFNMLLGYLSSNPITVHLAEYFNTNYKMTMYQMYLVARTLVPNNLKIQWVKTEKKIPDEELESIQLYYVCNKKTAEQYHQMLSKDQMIKVKQYYDFKKG